MENITGDYSCGACGWWGFADQCEIIQIDQHGFEHELRCPDCDSSRVGMITEEDFRPNNALYGCTWFGRKILFKD